MPITDTEIVLYKSANVSDLSTNGGRLSAVTITPGAKNNLFPDVTKAQREAGITHYRKLFVKYDDTDNSLAAEVLYWLDTPTQADDTLVFYPATQTDLQSAATCTTPSRVYGAGRLNAAATAGDTSISVALDGADSMFQVGDKIRVTAQTSLSDGVNPWEWAEVDTVSVLAGVATIGLASALVNSYAETVTRVASVYRLTNRSSSATTPVATSAGGSIDSGYSIAADHVGTVEQAWTLTFATATTVDITGDTLTGLPTGVSIAGDISPTNPDHGRPYWTLPAGLLAGTWTAGDTVTFSTSPMADPLWFRRDVPAGCPTLGNNTPVLGIEVESA